MQAANALAEVEGGSPAAVVFCPGLRWIGSLLIALSVIKITACVIQEKGPGGARRVCSMPLPRLGYGWWPWLAKRTCGGQGCLC